MLPLSLEHLVLTNVYRSVSVVDMLRGEGVAEQLLAKNCRHKKVKFPVLKAIDVLPDMPLE
jgi:hypothetical protein